jgi:hypothetical protein
MTMRADARPIRILRALAAAGPGGVSTPALTDQLGYTVPRQSALCHNGEILRRFKDRGLVAVAGWTPGGRRKGSAAIWAITRAGRDWLRKAEARQADDAAARRVKADRAGAAAWREKLLAGMRKEGYGRNTPVAVRRQVSRDLLTRGFTLQQIGDLFGVTREAIRLTVLPDDQRQARSAAQRHGRRTAKV